MRFAMLDVPGSACLNLGTCDCARRLCTWCAWGADEPHAGCSARMTLWVAAVDGVSAKRGRKGRASEASSLSIISPSFQFLVSGSELLVGCQEVAPETEG